MATKVQQQKIANSEGDKNSANMRVVEPATIWTAKVPNATIVMDNVPNRHTRITQNNIPIKSPIDKDNCNVTSL